jgi:cell division protein FtsL
MYFKSFLMMFILAILSAFIYLWQQNTATRFAYRVSDLRAAYDKINLENDFLKLKINSILALEKMDRIAKEKKLFRPGKNSIVYIS